MADALNKMLQFKMGEWTDKFDSMKKVPGTVYITTNEEAMYVDVSEEKRVRIGDIIQLNSSREANPPFSTKALYYFIEENALLKWGPFGVDENGEPNGTMAWKQLNSVSDITADLSTVKSDISKIKNRLDAVDGDSGSIKALEGRAKSLEDAIGKGVEGETNTVLARLTAAEAGVVANATAAQNADDKAVANTRSIEGLTTQLNTAKGTIESQGTAITGLTTRMGTAESNITTLQSGVQEINTAIGADETTGSLKGRIKAVETASTNNAGAITALDGEVDSVKGRMDTAEGNITTINNQITAINTAANALAGRVTALDNETTGRVKLVEDRVGVVETAITGNDGINSKLAGVIAESGQNKLDIEALDERVTALDKSDGKLATAEGKITALESLTGQHTTAIGQNTQDIADLAVSVDTNAKNISANAGVIAQHKSAIEALQATVGGNDGDSLTSKLTAVTDRVTALDKDGGRIALIEGRMTTAESDITTAKSDITTLKSDNTANKTQIVTNKSNIEGIQSILAGFGSGEGQEATVKGYVDKVKDALSAEIDSDILAANAMNFIEGVEKASDLPKSGVHVGDTYVATDSFTLEGVGTIYAGDLLIASGTEIDGVIAEGLVKWNHVETGYIHQHEASLTGEENSIRLRSHLNADLGTIQFVADANSNVSVSVANDKVTIGMVWGTFGEDE